MPESAEAALKGLLKDEATAADAIQRLEEAGFGITPPSGDTSYEDGGGEMPEAKEEDKEEGPPAGIVAVASEEGEGEDNPGPEEKEDKRESAAKKAMKSHGYKF